MAEGQGALRPEIQIETSVWPMRRLPVEQPLISFIAEAFKRPPELPAFACTAIVETAAEKFVGLTRRAGAELAGIQSERDPTLVRHICDLHAISPMRKPTAITIPCLSRRPACRNFAKQSRASPPSGRSTAS